VDTRAKRAAHNESLFRQVNERVESLSGALDTLTLVCECADPSCIERLAGISRPEYEAVRAHPARFIVAPKHERREFEDVVEERTGYLVVQKFGEAGAVAAEEDPRSD
jgi:hypothetical protein